jgi:porin-like protein
MRKSLLAITALVLTGAAALAAEQSEHQRSGNAAALGKLLPLKRATPGDTSGNSCAAYGAGFIKIEGSETCVKIGGAVGIGAGTSAGSR